MFLIVFVTETLGSIKIFSKLPGTWITWRIDSIFHLFFLSFLWFSSISLNSKASSWSYSVLRSPPGDNILSTCFRSKELYTVARPWTWSVPYSDAPRFSLGLWSIFQSTNQARPQSTVPPFNYLSGPLWNSWTTPPGVSGKRMAQIYFGSQAIDEMVR